MGDVPGADGGFSHRNFSPEHYADILRQFGVQAVVRLNSPHYDKERFLAAGIAVADLRFDDCTCPPVHVVAKFLALAESLPGALAVHCKAGLGRTGTLIALYMMKHHGFTARAAMGWLRVVRPGSVIGPQQAFLCEREALMHRSSAPLVDGAAAPGLGAGVGEVQAFVDATIRAFDRRCAASVPGCPGRASSSDTVGAEEAGRALAAHVAAAANGRAKRAGSFGRTFVSSVGQ